MARSFKHLTQLTPYLPYLGLLVIAILIFVGLGLYTLPSAARSFPEQFANSSASFTMYYADWCPHCKTALPEFQKLGSTMTIGGTSVVLQALEEQQIPPEMKDKIKGYPTIQLVKPDGSVMEYSGDRTATGFQQFLQQTLA
jgi:thiol-disulfide isomerase/thioredoxin